MKRLTLAFALMTLVASASAQTWKGIGRMSGKVLDPEGKPVPDATVKLNCAAKGGGPTLTTDKKGSWSFLGLSVCAWSIEASAKGFTGVAVVVNMPSEEVRQPPVNLTLETVKGPPPELVAAMKAGDEALAASNWAVARENYEKILAMQPELAPQVNPRLARVYVGEKNPTKAIEFLEKSIATDPNRIELRFAAAQAALDAGLTAKGLEFLAGIDDAAVKNADGYFNIGVAFMKASDLPNAVSYFTKAIAKDAKAGDAYYWRAMCHVRDSKLAEAKADMQKVLEIDPAGQYAEKAKAAVEQLKDVKP